MLQTQTRKQSHIRSQTNYAPSEPHSSINDCLTYQINNPHGEQIPTCAHKAVFVHTDCELRATG